MKTNSIIQRNIFITNFVAVPNPGRLSFIMVAIIGLANMNTMKARLNVIRLTITWPFLFCFLYPIVFRVCYMEACVDSFKA